MPATKTTPATRGVAGMARSHPHGPLLHGPLLRFQVACIQEGCLSSGILGPDLDQHLLIWW